MLSCFSHVQLFVTPWTATLQAPLFMGSPGQEYWSGLPFPPPGDLKKAQTPEVSLETHLLRVAGPGGGESWSSRGVVQRRLCYLLSASEKIFFKWKQIKGEWQACGSGLLFSLTRAKRQAWGSLFKSCQWHSFMLMYYKSLRAHARFHVFIWISDVMDPAQLLTRPASDNQAAAFWSTPSVECILFIFVL